jgi:hypothetical protein
MISIAMNKKPTLWIVGDSFSQPRKTFDRPTIWPEIVPALLSVDLKVNVELVNESWMGVSQDYCWMYLQRWVHEGRIQPEDYVIVIMTHPNRYWYLEAHPDLSNGHYTMDLDDYVTADQSQAIKLYMKEIQRPQLDTIQQLNRLGWLANAVGQYHLRRPLVIRAFDFDLYEGEKYTNLNVAQGDLYSLQNREFLAADQTDDTTTRYFEGIDPRYNHLTLSNHKILAGLISDSLINDTQLDLTQRVFIENIFGPDTMQDSEFVAAELNLEMLAVMQQKKDTQALKRNLTSWLRSAKIKQ